MATEVAEDGRRGATRGVVPRGEDNHAGMLPHLGDRALHPEYAGDMDQGVIDVAAREGVAHEKHQHAHHFLERAPSHVPKEYETRVSIISRFPEMKSVEETYYVKEIRNERRVIKIPKTRVVMEEHEHIEKVPVIKEVPRTRKEIVHRVVEEVREVTEMHKVVEMVDVPRKQTIPRVITEEIEEEVEVPTLVDVAKTRTKEVHTGNYLEAPAGHYINPGHFNLLGKGHGLLKHGFGGSRSSSSSSSDDEGKGKKGLTSKLPGLKTHKDKKIGSRSSSSSPERKGISAVSSSAPTTPQKNTAKKKSLLQRIEAKLGAN